MLGYDFLHSLNEFRSRSDPSSVGQAVVIYILVAVDKLTDIHSPGHK